MVKAPQEVEARVRGVLRDYDFILVSERMDESVTLLGLLLGVPPGDLLTVGDSKKSGNFHYFPWLQHKCVRVAKAKATKSVELFFNSSTWFAQNYGDYLLQQAASRSLDQTIDAWGKEAFVAVSGDRTHYLLLSHPPVHARHFFLLLMISSLSLSLFFVC